VNLGTIKGGRCYRTGSVKGTTLDCECQRTYTVDERREHSCEARQLRPRPVPPRVNHSFEHPLLGIAELLDCVPCLPASGRDSSRPLPRNGYASASAARYPQGTRGLFHFAGGRTHGGGLLGLGVNADQRHSTHSAAAGGNQVAASPQVRLHFFGQGVGRLLAGA
jgi:hypothetical protein